jgi:hypothetical protein
MHGQIKIAQTEPRLTAQALERVHALKGVATGPPAALLIDNA